MIDTFSGSDRSELPVIPDGEDVVFSVLPLATFKVYITPPI